MEFIVNALSLITTNFANFFTTCKNFFQTIVNFFNSTGSIIQTLRFGVKTLLSGTWSLIEEIFGGSLFDYLASGFNDLQLYIGFAGATFIASILFVIMVRICIGFVFKMFRLNVDYKTMKTKWK